MKLLFLLLPALLTALAGCTQTGEKKKMAEAPRIGGNCEGCEALYESPIPLDQLNHVDTLPGFNTADGPRIEISGVVFKADGKSPAPGVVIYVYHTDQQGIYPKKGDEKGWGKRHGYIRGLMKTNEKGEYRFFTLIPSSYPNSRTPKHIHATIKEPGKNEYYIDDFLFKDDPYLENDLPNRPPRGGNGILELVKKNGMFRARRDIVSGLNIPGYPG